MAARHAIFAALLLSSLHHPPIVPRRTLTPGAVFPVTVAQICQPGYARRVRDVPLSEKLAVFREYGIKPVLGGYEIDHLISLELGGSNDITNLWPESYTTWPWNAHVKDKIENHLHALVCHGKLDLGTAQAAIALNWIAAYRTYMPIAP